jgi:DNA repair protein RadD
MSYTLRPYQQEAVDKLLWSEKLPGADLCVLPTGAGKSLVIAELSHKIQAPILILQPTKEILEQNVEKMRNYVLDPEIGIYSASMDRKDISTYTFATIQSVYKKPELFSHFPYVIIDECHRVNPKDLGSMYASFLRDMGKPKVIGLTATPYRLDVRYERLRNGGILTHTVTRLINRTKSRFWHRLIFNVNVGDLIKQGYLVPLKYIDMSVISHDDIPINKSKSDFNLEAYEEQMSKKLDEILDAIFFSLEISKHVLVFCSSVAQAEYLQTIVPSSKVVTANTPKKEREKAIRDFRFGRTHAIFNVGVLTTGFDFPELDGIVLLRPTKSIGLYYQMLGRGVRISEGKSNCKVIDLTGTIKKLGRVETIRLEKKENWELLSEKGSWHNKPLYSFIINEYGEY